MKKYTTVIFFFLCCNLSFTQKKIVLDYNTKKQIPYVAINFPKNDSGFYTNERGVFSVEKVKSDSIYISHLGYESLKLKVSEIKDSIFLEPKVVFLDEVKIETGKSKRKNIGYLKKQKTLFWNIKPKMELATLFKYEKKYRIAYIDKIFIPIKKRQLDFINNKVEVSYPEFNSAFRVHIYSNSNGVPKDEILTNSVIINCNHNSPNIIEVDVSDMFIKIPKKGVFIGVEMIGEFDDKGNILNEKNKLILPSFQFTKKKKKNISSISYTRSVFSDSNKWLKNKNHNKIKNFSEYNMAISLTLNIYD